MDEGPFRVSRPADRRPVNRPEPAYRQPEEPQQTRVEPTPVARPTSAGHKTKSAKPSKSFKLPIVLIIAAILAIAIGLFAFTSMNKNGATAIDTSKYQAVFFTNGQVYFGKLSPLSSEYMKLTDIYYLQTKSSDTDANPQQTTSSEENSPQLIKLGNELHGPEDEMILSKDQVLFYENLKADGKVAQSIEQYKKSH